jgi:hypothetical protein
LPRAAAPFSRIRRGAAAKAEAYRLGIDAVGAEGYTTMQIASILGENKVRSCRTSRSAAMVRRGW